MTTELKFKRWFLNRFDGWSESYEPRRGSGVGMPDIQILLEQDLTPVELKIGFITPNGRLWISGFEPAQISWHSRFKRAGGFATVCVGIPEGKSWRPVRLKDFAVLAKWREGFSEDQYGPWTWWKG